MATTSWSNQLTRLFNAPLDRESVFQTHLDLLNYMLKDETPYEGQIIAVVDNSDGASATKIAKLYLVAKDETKALPDADVILGNNGNRWNLIDITTSQSTINYSETTGKLKDKVNLKVKENEFFDGTTGTDFDGSADIEIPLDLKKQTALLDIDDDTITTPNKDIFTKVRVNSRGLVTEGLSLEESDIPQLGQDKITFGVKQGDGSLAPNKFSDLNISDELGNLNNILLTSPANLQILSYDAVSKKWINSTVSAVSGGNPTLNFNGSNADVTGSGTGIGSGNEIELVLKTILSNPGTYTKLTVNAKGQVTAAENLTKTDIPTLDDTQVDFTTNKHNFAFFNIEDTLDNLSNVNISSTLADKDIIIYDAASQKWINIKKDEFTKHSHNLSDLDDTSITSPANKQLLFYDEKAVDNGDGTFSGKWKAGSLADIGVQASGNYVKEDDILDLNANGDVLGKIQFKNEAGNNELTLKEINSETGTYVKVDVNKKGLVTGGKTQIEDADIKDLDFTKLTNKPTTLSGYGITDAYEKSYHTKVASIAKTDGTVEVFENHPILLSTGGKLDASLIPNISVSNVRIANSEAEMITYQSILTGDVCIRNDINKTFIYSGEDMNAPEGSTVTSNVADWLEMLTPQNYIAAIELHGVSTNPKTGSSVSLDYSDMDAVPTLIKTGDLTTSDPAPTGTHTKVKVNSYGLVISGEDLKVEDLPDDIPQSKIKFGIPTPDADDPTTIVYKPNSFTDLNLSESLANLNDTEISADPVGKVLYNEAIYDPTDSSTVIGNKWVDKTLKELGAVAVLEEDLNVNIPGSIGGVDNGMVFNKGTSLELILKKLFTKASPVTYTKPTSNFSDNSGNMKEIEAGSTVSHTLAYSFTKNDAGNLKSWSVKKGNAVLTSGTTTLTGSPFKVTNYTLGDQSITYTFTCSYDEGAIKKDNLGNESPAGHIPAGTLTKTLTITGVRAYWGFGTTASTIPTAAEIRAKAKNGIKAKAGTVITANVAIGDQTVVFAYPETVKDCVSIEYKEINDPNAKTKFTQTTIAINDASGANPVNYRVYYYIASVPFAASATFKLTI